MLGKKKSDNEEVRAFLGKGAEFTGKLMFNGSVRIDGDFKGAIFGNGTTRYEFVHMLLAAFITGGLLVALR